MGRHLALELACARWDISGNRLSALAHHRTKTATSVCAGDAKSEPGYVDGATVGGDPLMELIRKGQGHWTASTMHCAACGSMPSVQHGSLTLTRTHWAVDYRGSLVPLHILEWRGSILGTRLCTQLRFRAQLPLVYTRSCDVGRNSHLLHYS